jgi:outer membrane protein assembly factor BamE (lipoprotein component of BamABCDE complex)
MDRHHGAISMRLPASTLASLLIVAGCAGYSGSNLQPGASETEVRSVMGTPAMEMRDPDGTRLLYYPRGPLGNQTYVASLNPAGTLTQVSNVLNDGTFNAIRPGLTEQEVLRMIGPPREKDYFSNLGQTAWDYKFQDTWGYEAIFSVMIDKNGIVVSKFTRRIERFDRGR